MIFIIKYKVQRFFALFILSLFRIDDIRVKRYHNIQSKKVFLCICYKVTTVYLCELIPINRILQYYYYYYLKMMLNYIKLNKDKKLGQV